MGKSFEAGNKKITFEKDYTLIEENGWVGAFGKYVGATGHKLYKPLIIAAAKEYGPGTFSSKRLLVDRRGPIVFLYSRSYRQRRKIDEFDGKVRLGRKEYPALFDYYRYTPVIPAKAGLLYVINPNYVKLLLWNGNWYEFYTYGWRQDTIDKLITAPLEELIETWFPNPPMRRPDRIVHVRKGFDVMLHRGKTYLFVRKGTSRTKGKWYACSVEL